MAKSHNLFFLTRNDFSTNFGEAAYLLFLTIGFRYLITAPEKDINILSFQNGYTSLHNAIQNDYLLWRKIQNTLRLLKIHLFNGSETRTNQH